MTGVFGWLEADEGPNIIVGCGLMICLRTYFIRSANYFLFKFFGSINYLIWLGSQGFLRQLKFVCGGSVFLLFEYA